MSRLTRQEQVALWILLLLLVVLLVPERWLLAAVGTSALLFLVLLGWLGARAGGAPAGRAIARVAFWGALAMALTAGIGRLFGTVVG